MYATEAQANNIEQHERFTALLRDFIRQVDSIDAKTMADGSDVPPWWFLQMQGMRREAFRILSVDR